MSKLIIECNSYLEGENLHMKTTIRNSPEIESLSPLIMEKILNLEENQIKEALIKLGWTPPRRI